MPFSSRKFIIASSSSTGVADPEGGRRLLRRGPILLLAGSVARALRPEHAAAVALLLAEALVVHLSCVLVHERVVADNNRQRNNPKKIQSLPFNPFLPLKTREGRWFFRFLDLGIAS
jgi:hypothetical protein